MLKLYTYIGSLIGTSITSANLYNSFIKHKYVEKMKKNKLIFENNSNNSKNFIDTPINYLDDFYTIESPPTNSTTFDKDIEYSITRGIIYGALWPYYSYKIYTDIKEKPSNYNKYFKPYYFYNEYVGKEIDKRIDLHNINKEKNKMMNIDKLKRKIRYDF